MLLTRLYLINPYFLWQTKLWQRKILESKGYAYCRSSFLAIRYPICQSFDVRMRNEKACNSPVYESVLSWVFLWDLLEVTNSFLWTTDHEINNSMKPPLFYNIRKLLEWCFVFVYLTPLILVLSFFIQSFDWPIRNKLLVA